MAGKVAKKNEKVLVNRDFTVVVPEGYTYSTDKSEINGNRKLVFIKTEENSVFKKEYGDYSDYSLDAPFAAPQCMTVMEPRGLGGTLDLSDSNVRTALRQIAEKMFSIFGGTVAVAKESGDILAYYQKFSGKDTSSQILICTSENMYSGQIWINDASTQKERTELVKSFLQSVENHIFTDADKIPVEPFVVPQYRENKRCQMGTLTVAVPDHLISLEEYGKNEEESFGEVLAFEQLKEQFSFLAVPKNFKDGFHSHLNAPLSFNCQQSGIVKNPQLAALWIENENLKVDRKATFSDTVKNALAGAGRTADTVHYKTLADHLDVAYARSGERDDPIEYWCSYYIAFFHYDTIHQVNIHINSKKDSKAFERAIEDWISRVRPASEEDVAAYQEENARRVLGLLAGKNGKIDGFKGLQLFFEDVFFFVKGQLLAKGRGHEIKGIQVNAQKIDEFPQIKNNLSVFGTALTELINFVEEDELLILDEECVHRDFDKLNKVDPMIVNGQKVDVKNAKIGKGLSGARIFLLAAWHMIKIVENGENNYLVVLDQNLFKGIPNATAYVLQLIKRLREYNGLSGAFSAMFMSAFVADNIMGGAISGKNPLAVFSSMEAINVADGEDPYAPVQKKIAEAKAENVWKTWERGKNGGDDEEIFDNEYYLRELGISAAEDELPLPLTVSIEGTGYEGRNERIEHIKVGDPLILKADYDNKFYSPVAIEVFNKKKETLGYLSKGFGFPSLEDIAKIIDKIKARVASVTPLSKRSKRAKYALMDVELYLDDSPAPKETKPSSETHKKKEKQEKKAPVAEEKKATKAAEEKAFIAKIESADKKIRAFKEGENTLRSAVSDIRAERRKAEQRYDRAEREVEQMASNSIDVFSYDLEDRIRDVIKTATDAAEELCDDCDKLIKKMDKLCAPYLESGMDPHLIKAVADEMRELLETADINVNFSGSFEGTSFGNVGNIHYEASAAAGKIVKKWRTESKKTTKAFSVDGLLKECGVSKEEHQRHLSYKDAIAEFNTAKTAAQIKNVQKTMKSLNGYLDSVEYLQKCEEMIPKLVEKEKKKAAEKAAQEARRKAEEEEKARKAAEEQRIYEEKYAIWCTEKKTIEARRAETLREKIDVFRTLLDREVENWYSTEKQRLEEKEASSRTERMEAESKLESLGFFKFKEKSNCKQVILQTTQVLEALPNEKRKITSEYKRKKSEVEEKVKKQEDLLVIKIAKDYPIPAKPEKPAVYKPLRESATKRTKKSTAAPKKIFTGYTFVVADMPSAKEDARIRREIKLRGGTPVTTVTQKLDYLVCSRVKRGITTRIDAALDNQKKGFPVKIITIKEFEEMISE